MKKLFRYIIPLLLSHLFLLPFAFGQKGRVSGTVRGIEGPLSAATLAAGKVMVATDESGWFSLLLDSGHHTLVVTHTGYKKAAKEVHVATGNSQTVEIFLVADETMGEVVVVGSRSTVQRTNLNTPVPVDVFTSGQLLQTGQISLTQMLNVAAPSFNASRELLNEPITLRGLDPQHVLILLNGTRFHNTAWFYGGGLKGQLGRGSAGNDLNAIPLSAIEKVEILRDGAAAQYGSDAIAGIINIRLKESTGKWTVRLHTGKYYKGDGEKVSVGVNRGFALGKKGFLNLSFDYRYQEPAFRGGEYKGTVYINIQNNTSAAIAQQLKAQDDSLVRARGFNRKAVIDNFGTLKTRSVGFLANGAYRILRRTEAFWTATASQRRVWRDETYRFPKNSQQVNLALYPDGFQAKSHPNTIDVSAVFGLKGQIAHGGNWTITTSYGRNAFSRRTTHNNNASQSYMGKDAPTAFYLGKQVYQQLTNNAHFSKLFTGNAKSLNVAAGAEWRMENYYTEAGDSASWHNYTPGSQAQASVGGFRPEDVINKTRNVWSAYLDLEAERADRLLLNIAARYEHYSDFGRNLAGKLATRYKISKRWMLRLSLNNGFRAPSLQQRYYSFAQNAFVRRGGTALVPAVNGVFPNNHPLTKALGIRSLTAERSLNVSGGVTAKPARHISLTADVYWIQIKNRVVLSNPYYRKDNWSLDSILTLYADLDAINQVSFFTNAINTRTYGADLVLNGFWRFPKSSVQYTLAANVNRVKVFGGVQVPDNLPANGINTNILFNRADRAMIEKGQPQHKATLTLSYRKGPLHFILTNTRYGRTTVFHENDSDLDQTFSPKILTDLSLQYIAKGWLTVTVGANNLFNIYPDKIRYYENTNYGLLIYSPEASPFGFYGGYYFAALEIRLPGG